MTGMPRRVGGNKGRRSPARRRGVGTNGSRRPPGAPIVPLIGNVPVGIGAVSRAATLDVGLTADRARGPRPRRPGREHARGVASAVCVSSRAVGRGSASPRRGCQDPLETPWPRARRAVPCGRGPRILSRSGRTAISSTPIGTRGANGGRRCHSRAHRHCQGRHRSPARCRYGRCPSSALVPRPRDRGVEQGPAVGGEVGRGVVTQEQPDPAGGCGEPRHRGTGVVGEVAGGGRARQPRDDDRGGARVALGQGVGGGADRDGPGQAGRER